MNALAKIEDYLQNPTHEKKKNDGTWLSYLITADNPVQNLEHVSAISDLSNDSLLRYVHRTLLILDSLEVESSQIGILESVLKWSEVAKGGSEEQKAIWLAKGINLTAHNKGSASIYSEHIEDVFHQTSTTELIGELIRTHGLLGQFLRGEAELGTNRRLAELLQQSFTKEEAYSLLYNLNTCIIGGVSQRLWSDVKDEISDLIGRILDGDFEEVFVQRLGKLRNSSRDPIDTIEEHIQPRFHEMKDFFSGKDLWYVESSFHDFQFVDFWTLFQEIQQRLNDRLIQDIHFGKLMKQMYYDYKGEKRVNIYRLRIVEKYLNELRTGIPSDNPHVDFRIDYIEADKAAHPYFAFSDVGEALIQFCVEAEKVDLLHSKASVLLYDFFELRKDDFDRLHNEQSYLSDMNGALEDKRVMLDYVTGNAVADIGPGGGVLLDLLAQETDANEIFGIDVSANVIEELNKKKAENGSTWIPVRGDALALHKVFEPGSVDTIIFSSVLHELFSYIPYNGKKFNYAVLTAALTSAFFVLAPGGRIIIRDGIMTEETGELRRIRFRNPEDVKWLKAYQALFKGRKIKYHYIYEDEVAMPVNDALEFLYTYTWGEEAFSHEVNEQFAYFTPYEYISFIKETLGDQARIIHFDNYLQDGYTLHLRNKIDFMDMEGNPAILPDSTCLIVIEKNPESGK